VVVGLVAWHRARHHDDPMAQRAVLRDRVLIAATHGIETMNTLDYRDLDGGLAAWADVTTGTLHDQLVAISKPDRALLADQHTSSVGKVLAAGLVDLDHDSASVIAAVEVTVTPGDEPEAKPTVKRNRFAADLVKVGGRWLLESLQQVSVATGASAK
jgi:Mce-associated membrane protein